MAAAVRGVSFKELNYTSEKMTEGFPFRGQVQLGGIETGDGAHGGPGMSTKKQG